MVNSRNFSVAKISCFTVYDWFAFQIVGSDQKLDFLVSFLKHHKSEKHMLFFSTCACVDYFSCALKQ